MTQGNSMEEQVTMPQAMFRPFRGAHAIQEVIFRIEFSRDFTEDEIKALQSLQPTLQGRLPTVETMELLRLEVSSEELLQGRDFRDGVSRALGAIRFFRADASGNLLKQLSFAGGALTYHCMDYTRWDREWGDAREALRAGMPCLEGAGRSITQVSLRYIDRFVFAGDLEAYSADGLFRRENNYLAPYCFRAGPMWHCHSGWFDPIGVAEEALHCLHQLNIGTSVEADQHATVIDHAAVVDLGEVSDFSSLMESVDGNPSKIDFLMNVMHDGNRAILLDLLTEQMVDNIHLRTIVS